MSQPPAELLPAAIKRAMTERGITKITAAARIIGVGKRDLRQVIAGERRPNQRTFQKYAKFLGMSVQAIEALAEGGTPSKTSFIYSEEVDAAVRAIQDSAVHKVIGSIRPDLIRSISSLNPAEQAMVLSFVNRVASHVRTTKAPVKLVKGQSKAKRPTRA